jgi:hypothetical protein
MMKRISILFLAAFTGLLMTMSSCSKDKVTSETPALAVSAENVSATTAAGSYTVNITANVAWTAASNQTWCSISPASGEGNGTLTINVAENTALETRTASVSVKAGDLTKTVTVVQLGVAPALSVNVTAINVTAEASDSTIAITSNLAWTATSSETWCSVSPASGNGSGVLTITIAENTTVEARTATVTVSAGDLTQTVAVAQSGATPVLSVDTTKIDAVATATAYAIKITSNLAWTVTSNETWCSILPTSGKGDSTLTVNVAENTAIETRTATVTITAGTLTCNITVTQDAAISYYSSGEVIQLHRHTVGDGIAIVIIGDGFDREDCKKGGVYEYNCKKLCNLFLSMPVIRDYKDYFDVLARVDISIDRGARNCVETPENCPRNNYGVGHPDLDLDKIHENAALTAGKYEYSTIFMGNGMIGGHVIGSVVAVYSADEPNKPYWMMHEFTGRLVGLFPRLFYLGETGLMNDNTKELFDIFHEQGDLLMFDWRSDPKTVYWKDFIGRSGYEEVGVYPAGLNSPPLAFGQIFCCENIETDVMFGPTAHYNVMERYQLWRKIQLRAGFTAITFAEFIEYDKVNIVDKDYTWDRYDNWTDDRIWKSDD